MGARDNTTPTHSTWPSTAAATHAQSAALHVPRTAQAPRSPTTGEQATRHTRNLGPGPQEACASAAGQRVRSVGLATVP